MPPPGEAPAADSTLPFPAPRPHSPRRGATRTPPGFLDSASDPAGLLRMLPLTNAGDGSTLPSEPRCGGYSSSDMAPIPPPNPELEARLSNVRMKLDFADQVLRHFGEGNARPLLSKEERRREMVHVEAAKLIHFVARHFNLREELEEITGYAMDEKDSLAYYRWTSFSDSVTWKGTEDTPSLTLEELRRESARMLVQLNAEVERIEEDPQRRRSVVEAHRVRSNLSDFLWLIESLELEMPPQQGDMDEEIPFPWQTQQQRQQQEQEKKQKEQRSTQSVHSAGDTGGAAAVRGEPQQVEKLSSSHRYGSDAGEALSLPATSMSSLYERIIDFSVDQDSLDSLDTAAKKLRLLKFMYEAIRNNEQDVKSETEYTDEEFDEEDPVARSMTSRRKSSGRRQKGRPLSPAARGTPFITQTPLEETPEPEESEVDESLHSRDLSAVADAAPSSNAWTQREFMPTASEVKVQPVPAELYDVLRKLYDNFDYDDYFKHYHDIEKHGIVYKSEAEQIALTEERLEQQKRRKEALLKKKEAEREDSNLAKVWSSRSVASTKRHSIVSFEESAHSQVPREAASVQGDVKSQEPSPLSHLSSSLSQTTTPKLADETIMKVKINTKACLQLKGRRDMKTTNGVVGKKTKKKKHTKREEKGEKAAHKGDRLAHAQLSFGESLSSTCDADIELLCNQYEELTLEVMNKGNDTLSEVLNIDRKKLKNTKIFSLMEKLPNDSILMNVSPNTTKPILLLKPIAKRHDMRFLEALSVGARPNSTDISDILNNKISEKIKTDKSVIKSAPDSAAKPLPLQQEADLNVPSSLEDVHNKDGTVADKDTAELESRGSLDALKRASSAITAPEDLTGSAAALPEGERRPYKKRPPPLPLSSILDDNSPQSADFPSRVEKAASSPEETYDADDSQRPSRRGTAHRKSKVWRKLGSLTSANAQLDVNIVPSDQGPQDGDLDKKSPHSQEDKSQPLKRERRKESTTDAARKSTLRGKSVSSSVGFKAKGKESSDKKDIETDEQAQAGEDTEEIPLETRPVDQWGVPLAAAEDEAFEKNCVALSALQAGAWADGSTGAQIAAGETSDGKLITGKAEEVPNYSVSHTSGQSITSSVLKKGATPGAGADTSTLEGDIEGKLLDENAEEAAVNAALQADSSGQSQLYPKQRFGNLTSAEEVVTNFLNRIALEEGAEPQHAEKVTLEDDDTLKPSISVEDANKGHENQTGLFDSSQYENLDGRDIGNEQVGSFTKTGFSDSEGETRAFDKANMSVPFEGYDVALLLHSRNTPLSGKEGVSRTSSALEGSQPIKVAAAGLASASSGPRRSTTSSAHCEACAGSTGQRPFLHEEGESALAGEDSRRSSMVQRIQGVLKTRKEGAAYASTPASSTHTKGEGLSIRTPKPTPKVRRGVVRLPDSPTVESPGAPTDLRIYKDQLPSGGVALFVPEDIASASDARVRHEKVGRRYAPRKSGAGRPSGEMSVDNNESIGSEVARQREAADKRRPTALRDLSNALHGYARLAPLCDGSAPKNNSKLANDTSDTPRYGALPPIRSNVQAPIPVHDVEDLEAAEGEALALFLQDPVRYDCVIDDIIKSATDKVGEEMIAQEKALMGEGLRLQDEEKRAGTGLERRSTVTKDGVPLKEVSKGFHSEVQSVDMPLRRHTFDLTGPSEPRSTAVEVVADASELNRILDEQVRAKRIIAYVLTEMRRMWKRREMEANAAFRIAVDRFIKRSLLFTWRFERRRVLNLQKLIHLLDRRSGRVAGWVPFYAKDSFLVDRYVWEKNPPHLSRPLRVVHNAMCLARRQRLLPLHVVRVQAGFQNWKRNGNPHLLLGYRRTLVEPFLTTATRLRRQRRARFAAPFQHPTKRFTPKILREVGTPYV